MGTSLTTAALLLARLFTPNGVVEMKLDPAFAPRTVSNFVDLARAGFYAGSAFDRTVPGVLLQGGGAKDRPGDGPGYCIKDEDTPLHHDRAGVVSMASPGPGMNGSRFQITLGPAPALDGRATVFGEVTSGMEVVRNVATGLATAGPLAGVSILKVEIVGDWTSVEVPKEPEPSGAELEALFAAPAKSLVAGVGSTLKLGRPKAFVVSSARSRCSDAQIVYDVDYGTAGKGRLLLNGKVGYQGVTIRQMQFESPKKD